MLDSPATHSGNEAPTELNTGPLSVPVGHSAKLSPTPRPDNPTMAYVISCDCGYVSRGETEDELVDVANRHMEEVHPEMAGKVSREDLLAMSEEV